VAKIGTASITDDPGHISTAAIAKLVDEVADLRRAGHEVIVVSSGAVAAGVAALGLAARPTDMRTLQAVSAVGQSRLVQA
jgi:glutamate 5-kinase